MLIQNPTALLVALSFALGAAGAHAGVPDVPESHSAAQYFEQQAKAPQSDSSDGLPDISTAMKGLLSNARDGGDVLRTWAAFKTGDPAALPKLFELAKGGSSRAQNIVGYLLDHGQGVRKDSGAAAAYFKAAAQGYPLAQYNLAVLTLLGRGVPKNEDAAMQLFESSMKSAGVDLAAIRLSLFYLKKGDKDKAWTWANEGANRGNVTAYYLLGRMLYERGEFAEAYNWLTKAAQASEPNAPAILSAMYKNGQGMDQNLKMGASWWLIYLGLNKNNAGGAASVSAFGLTAKEEADASSFASNWLSTHKNMTRPDYDATLLQASRTDQS